MLPRKCTAYIVEAYVLQTKQAESGLLYSELQVCEGCPITVNFLFAFSHKAYSSIHTNQVDGGILHADLWIQALTDKYFPCPFKQKSLKNQLLLNRYEHNDRDLVVQPESPEEQKK